MMHMIYDPNDTLVRDQLAVQDNPVCIGDGLDATSDGIIATVVLPSAFGMFIWLLFSVIRPRYRQIYATREWFVQQNSRPKTLSSSLGAYIFPSNPLVPSIPTDFSDTGKSLAIDSRLFPSDEELSQRTLWTGFLLVLGWTVVGLAGALPLYLVSTPCLAKSTGVQRYNGVYSTIQDLSLLRLLKLMDNNSDDTPKVRLRIIILVVLTLVVAMLPAFWKVLQQFEHMITFRRNWLELRCGGLEMGWLSARRATGFAGWGEPSLKNFIAKIGLSSSFRTSTRTNANGRRARHPLRQDQDRSSLHLPEEDGTREIDIHNLFSVGDTHTLALLIEERDGILDNLEIAETRYISSFKLSTPDPSITDLEPRRELVTDPNRPHISRPRALGAAGARRRNRRFNPAHAASSLAPTSFVAPSQYYKLRGLSGVNGGRLSVRGSNQLSFTDSFQQRIVGSRFQEVTRDSTAYDRLPLGSLVIEKPGERPGSSPIPDPRYYGPNHTTGSSSENGVVDSEIYQTANSHGTTNHGTASHGITSHDTERSEEDDWVDLMRELPIDFGDARMQGPSTMANPNAVRQNPIRRTWLKPERRTPSTDRRESFPLRKPSNENTPADGITPPHLRLQPRQPFVRPASGLNYDDLGAVYAEINEWRSRLKAINAEIDSVQKDCYSDIAEGIQIKGWLFIGRGLRYIPGMQMIEGRAKEDIRWDVLQHEGHYLDLVAFWIVIIMVTIFLVVGVTAASGLALGIAPNVAHYLPFLEPLSAHNGLVSGLATSLAPALAVVLFIVIAIAIVNWAADFYRFASFSAGQILKFKITFFVLTFVAAAWLMIAGAIIFAIDAFSSGSKATETVADGFIYTSAFALALIVSLAISSPGLLLLQPFRLWSVLRAERDAMTPRQRFRAVYPQVYNPSFALSACTLAIVFASALSLIFPLMGPAAVILLFLTLIAHRFLIGHVYVRTLSQTGGLLQIWLLKRFGTLITLQPFILGLILFTRQLWVEGGVLVGVSVFIAVAVEVYMSQRMKTLTSGSLQTATEGSLRTFLQAAKSPSPQLDDEEGESSLSTEQRIRARSSMASVLEMMQTLAASPLQSHQRGPLPLQTETLNDLVATERAARTHPDAPPHLPPPFADPADEISGVLYAPELLAPPPIIWLPNDTAGVAQSEADDLQKYHDIRVTLDVQATEDVLPQQPSRRMRT